MKVLLLSLMFMTAPNLLLAEDAAGLLAKAYLFSPSSCYVIRFDMAIQDAGGTKNREVELYMDRRQGHVFSLSRILKPAFMSDMKFLKRSQDGKNDGVWIKTSNGVRRIGEGNKNESVFGSQFTIEDFGSIDDKGFDLSIDDPLGTATEAAVSATPNAPTAYARRIIWVDRISGLIMKMEYRDATNRTLRRYSVIRTGGSGKDLRPIMAKMEDIDGGGATVISLLSYSSPLSLPERLFNPGSL